eukprot:CAMPEP_0203985874 /NCGR_PEP_ID=MMETSP0360-20130528/5604_1 /ASSEMBLY_ACC=CAM_ASM_000342 /TAXON_ID=268821 /ORGANISM="Scrippsiella Hangoei, Strain SHTV-5" /LENGTH=43 /DNA_ID= /DNA_START= /DNA_END= /DNA_ORIENTATION=
MSWTWLIKSALSVSFLPPSATAFSAKSPSKGKIFFTWVGSASS